ncbi:MAG: hypothetical protein RLN76_07785 [Phycisphaeraceae bacterium]
MRATTPHCHLRPPPQLTPDNLEAIPEDPFNPGHPLNLLSTPYGIAIYSCGPDLDDDLARSEELPDPDFDPDTYEFKPVEPHDRDITASSFTTPGIKQPLPQP